MNKIATAAVILLLLPLALPLPALAAGAGSGVGNESLLPTELFGDPMEFFKTLPGSVQSIVKWLLMVCLLIFIVSTIAGILTSGSVSQIGYMSGDAVMTSRARSGLFMSVFTVVIAIAAIAVIWFLLG